MLTPHFTSMIPTTPELVIPRERLPADATKRQAVLTDYFRDLVPTVVDAGQELIIRLRWPEEEAFFVDPLLTQHLDWWRAGVRLEQLRQEVYWSDVGQLSLDDAWTLFSWSRWLTQRCGTRTHPEEVVILHIDDHRDMMCPHIIRSGQGWMDLFTGKPFSALDPPSVLSAICSGAVGIGSFFTPFLHELPRVHVRHLCQSGRLTRDRHEWCLVTQTEGDTLLRPGELRPRIDVADAKAHRTQSPGNNDSHSYRHTSSIPYCFSDLPECPVLLHIDMDYFNNRYNRDSDWNTHHSHHDPPLEQVLDEIDRLFHALTSYGIVNRVENVSVALSPGFFPSEYWQASLERMQLHLLKHGLTLGRREPEV